MKLQPVQDISELLVAWGNGDEEALNALISVVYPELRRIARQHLVQRASGHTLESAALANEAYLKLIRARGIHCESRLQFFALCAQIIRRILVDHARRRRYAKRGAAFTNVGCVYHAEGALELLLLAKAVGKRLEYAIAEGLVSGVAADVLERQNRHRMLCR